jgi:hypothetical protein
MKKSFTDEEVMAKQHKTSETIKIQNPSSRTLIFEHKYEVQMITEIIHSKSEQATHMKLNKILWNSHGTKLQIPSSKNLKLKKCSDFYMQKIELESQNNNMVNKYLIFVICIL